MPTHSWPDGRIPVLLSAHAEELIAEDAQAILRYLDREPPVTQVAGQLLRTRRVRRHRCVIRAGDLGELAAGLRALAAGDDHPLVARSTEPSAPRTTFVFPGQGTQWPSMGADAYRVLPVYRAAADRCAEAFDAAGLPSPVTYLTTDRDPDTFCETEIQGAQFTHAVALAAVWRSCGVVPDLTVGHSLGEIAAAYIAESITLSDAVAVLAARAGVVDRLPGRYAVAALGITAEAAQELIANTPGWLELSVVNAASAVAVSGDREAVTAAVNTVQGRGQFAREITVNFPVHTSVLDPLQDWVQGQLPCSEFADTPVQFIGSVTGDVVAPGTDFTDYWYKNLRSMVRFDHAVRSALRCGAKVFVELSTHPSLLHAIGEVLDESGDSAVLLGSGRRGEPLVEQLSANVAAAAVADPSYRWADFMDAAQEPLRDFPNAPMRKLHMWATPEPLSPAPGLTVAIEKWQRTAPPTPRNESVRRIALLELGSQTPLAQRLHAAIDRHPGTVAASSKDADVVVAIAPALEDSDAAQAAAELTDLVGDGLLGYVSEIGPQCRDVWLLTVGGEQAAAGDPAPLPGQAALAAMHRSIGFEHPDQSFGHLDLASRDLGETAAATVLDVLIAGGGEVALRETSDGPVLYGREVGGTAPAAPAWPADSGVLDDVVITGGAGAIGLHYARYFAERGARRIVLLSRRGADAAMLAKLAERHGTQVLSPPCDITDRGTLAATAAEFAGDGASLLIHAAGTATFAESDRLTEAVFADTFGAKVTGLAHMTDLWPLRPDSRILLCSSVIGVWGGKGTAAYAAANRMLDAMAHQLRARGLRCVAVRWGLWQGSAESTGIVDADETARVQRTGLRPMPPTLAIEASLYDHVVDPLILAADADRIRLFFGSQGPAAVSEAPVTIAATTAEAVRIELAAVLNIAEIEALNLDASLFDLGVDSLLALDLRKRLKKATGRTVPLAKLLGGITGAELITNLEDHRESENFA
ncbi:mycobactin polyketide synthase MbtD [Mycobacterium hubeiense]|uniref:mycobactin polyketide synthase MbtD n=1 Tax=Mycobacterium hubeiense TaxID=1867256 RepID=UPI000C7ED373|nr:mycobactin polyketide synthase MbtD [Mycobacterium sp. QGD 101]